jgi:hypothetical protein
LLCYHKQQDVKWGDVVAGEAKQSRRRGRPRRWAPGKRPTLTFRVQEDMHKELAATAKHAGRSISEEIERRLNEWAGWQKAKLDIERMLADAKTEVAARRIQAIRQAGFQIQREAGGNITVNISPEMLFAEADGILRSGFVAEENIDKSPTEIMIERVVERVVENALAKAGLLGRKGVA